MFTEFLSILKGFFSINLGYNVERFEHLFTLDRKDFPDCTDKEIRYAKRLWNPFGKTGVVHHGSNGWDWFTPE
jgi:hypothetical protein